MVPDSLAGTSSGPEFERAVSYLFQSSGYDVDTSVLCGHKKVDMLISERRFGKVRKIAVECKNYERPLTQEQVSTIYANYLPLVDQRLVDEIVLVTKNSISETAKSLVSSSTHLSHMTLIELQTSIMDFTLYLQSLLSHYSEDGLNQYYVPPRAVTGEDLEQLFEDWLGQPFEGPIAFLGSYGLGKTSFARSTASRLAARCLGDSTARIPILVKLGEITNEQSLEGLLGKLLAATNQVRNYSFATLLELNKRGRLIFIFDGFDEMKQAMTLEDFRYNMKEINRLIVDSCKVVILGRPTAFLSDAEHNHLLHGIRTNRDGREFRDIEWPDYREVSVAPFSREQMSEFLRKYTSYLASSAKNAVERSRFASISNGASEIVEKRFNDIARRPVQLKMIAEILPDFHGDLDRLTVHDLYDYFVDYVIERESYKLSRKRFTTVERRKFAGELAYWLWRNQSHSLTEIKVPQEILAQFSRPGDDDEAITRDLVSACLLDRKLHGTLYFPHRSLQEYLVAEAISGSIVDGRLNLEQAQKSVTLEISNFMEGFCSEKTASAFLNQISNKRGDVTLLLLSPFYKRPVCHNVILDRAKDNLWALLMASLAMGEEALTHADDQAVEKLLREKISATKDAAMLMQLFFFMLIATKKWRSRPAEISKRLGFCLERICGFEIVEVRKNSIDRKKDAARVIPKLLKEFIRLIVLSSPRGTSMLTLTGIYRTLRSSVQSSCFLTEWKHDGISYHQDAGFPDKIPMWGANAYDTMENYLKKPVQSV